MHFNTCTDFGR